MSWSYLSEEKRIDLDASPTPPVDPAAPIPAWEVHGGLTEAGKDWLVLLLRDTSCSRRRDKAGRDVGKLKPDKGSMGWWRDIPVWKKKRSQVSKIDKGPNTYLKISR